MLTTPEVNVKLTDFLQVVNTIAANNWIQSIVVGGVTINATVSAADQTSIIANYQTLKTAISTAFATLP